MSYPETLERRRMSLEEFLALPEGIRAEYVDGEVIMTPPPERGHNKVVRRLANLLEEALPGLDVAAEAGLRRAAERRFRIADIAVFPEFEDVSWSDATPALVVEVLSPSTRSEDMLRKSDEYRSAGIGQYWLVDRERHSLTVLRNNGSGWDIVLELDADHPSGQVQVGEYAAVVLDLEALLTL